MGRISRLLQTCARRLPWGLLGMIAMVATAELLATRYRHDLSTTTVACWTYAGQNARRERTSEILCLGTSLVKHGVLPRVIEDRTGKRSANLAIYAGPIPASYYLLRRVLEAGARPSALIIDCQDLAVPGRRLEDYAEPFLLHTRLWSDLLDVRDCLDLAWETRDADFFVRTMLSWALPTVRARFEVRASVLAALAGKGGSGREVIKVHQRNWTVNRGAHIFPHDVNNKTDESAKVVSVVRPEAIPPDLRVLDTLPGRYARRLVALADEHRIVTFWLLPPLTSREQAKRTRTGEDACLLQLARTLQTQARNLIILDGRSSGYDRRVFADAVHLDRNGAAILSDAVGTTIARYFKDPSTVPPWVTLPRFRDRLPQTPIEDYGESYLAMKSRGLVR